MCLVVFPDLSSLEVVTLERESVLEAEPREEDDELLTEDEFELVDLDDLDVETVLDDDDLDEFELPPPLLACAKASDWNAVSANPSSATAIVVLSVFIIKKFYG